MEGDSSGWEPVLSGAVRRPDLPLLSTQHKGWLSVSLTAPLVMSVMPGDTGSHVTSAESDSEQLRLYLFIYSAVLKDILFHPFAGFSQLAVTGALRADEPPGSFSAP